jgi:hypothetical protein
MRTSQKPVQAIEKLHTLPDVAWAIGCHPISLYKAASGQSKMPAPRVIRIGRLVRVRDCDLQSFLNGLSSVRVDNSGAVGGADLTPAPVKKRMGRPTKAMQLAKAESAFRLAGGAA